MKSVELKLTEKGRGFFIFKEEEEPLGQMEITIAGKQLIVFHTEVVPKEQGKGIAKRLLKEMVHYSRENNLKVTALCPFVFEQFKHHPEQYSDIWQNKSNAVK